MKSFVYVVMIGFFLAIMSFGDLHAQPSSQAVIDSLQNLLKTTKIEDTTKVNILNEIAKNYYAINPNNGLLIGRKALALAQRLNFKSGIANTHNTIGLNHWYMSNYSAALKNLLYALDIYEENKDTTGIIKIRGNIGLIYYLAGMTQKGIEQQLIVKNIDKKYKDTITQIMSLINLGGGYRELKDYNRSLLYYNEAIALKDKYNAKEFDYHLLLNRAMTLAKLNMYNEAFKSINDAHIAKANFGMNDKYRETIWDAEYCGLIITYFADTNKAKSLVTTLEQNKKKLLLDASRKVKSTIDFFKAIQATNELKNSYFNYAVLLKMKGDIDSSYYYHLLGCELRDSLEDKANVETIRLIDVERELAIQKNEILRENDYNHYYRMAIAAGLLFIIVLSVIIVYLIKVLAKNKILNTTLKEKNEQIMQTNAELEALVDELSEKQLLIAEANDKLHLANQAKDKFFSIISHDLRSPFTGIIGLSELLANDFDRIPKSEIQNTGRAIYTAAKNTYSMLNSLLEWAKTQMGALQFNPDVYTVKARIECTLINLVNTAKAKNISIQYDVAEPIQIKCDADMIDTVLRNLISNSIKFTNPGGRILVTAIKDNNYAKFCVKDNGVGMSHEVIANLFNIEKVTSSKGTNSEIGSGLGLLLCKEFVDKHNGKIWAESEIGKGTTFCFTVPISM